MSRKVAQTLTWQPLRTRAFDIAKNAKCLMTILQQETRGELISQSRPASILVYSLNRA